MPVYRVFPVSKAFYEKFLFNMSAEILPNFPLILLTEWMPEPGFSLKKDILAVFATKKLF